MLSGLKSNKQVNQSGVFLVLAMLVLPGNSGYHQNFEVCNMVTNRDKGTFDTASKGCNW